MERIRVLPTEVANRIAAGEVVERPASVVKELVENAIDAGATRIEVALDEGGLAGIKITDDGHGMGPEDLRRAILPHATSKISDVDDLFRIASFGFRGEALPSIASVARLSITSREPEAAEGHELLVQPGREPILRPAAAKVGTVVEVRELFANVPARRHFLKAARTEYAQILEMVTRLAHPAPEVAFRVLHEGRIALELRADTDRGARLRALEGKEVFERLLVVRHAEESMRLEAYVSPPDLVRATARSQELWLNGRWIRDRSLLHAFRDAYRGLIMPKDHPMGWLFLDIDPAAVDVNVHPTKSEVRFRERDQVFRFVRHAVERALAAARTEGAIRIHDGGEPSSPQAPGSRIQPEAGQGAVADPVREVTDDLFPRPSPAPVVAERAPAVPPRAAEVLREPAPRPRSKLARACSELVPRAERLVPTGAEARFLQLHRSYILVETAHGLRVLDQHALHERQIFEELKARFAGAPGEDQRLLVPEVLSLPASDKALLLEHTADLSAVGISLSDFGGTTVALHAVPVLLARRSASSILEPIVQTLREEGRIDDTPELVLRTLGNLACRAAVTFNTRLEDEEIRHLLAWFENHPHARNCPHGRPISLQISLEELELQFARKK